MSVALWKGLERNDFSRWPTGIYARSYVRDYAAAIGVDPESTVDDFCRWFPQGDRRAEREIRGQAQIVGHDNLEWRDAVPPVVKADGDRRGAAAASAAKKAAARRGLGLRADVQPPAPRRRRRLIRRERKHTQT